jgi:hypothetical protein
MSFLDNLENNLKALESREEKDPEQRRRELTAREAQRAEALRRAPHAEALKTGPFTEKLLTACRTVGHGMRVLVRFTWIDSMLRLEAKDKKLELHPTGDGVRAVYFVNGAEITSEMVNLNGDAEAFARSWLRS